MIKTHEVYYPLYNDKEHFIFLITGGRACERPTQEVMMADLSVKQIKDIVVGDKVMGDDGTPRTVLSTHKGFGKMFAVRQSRGKTYYVNDGHYLTLFDVRKQQTIDVSVLEYFCMNANERCFLWGVNNKEKVLITVNVKQIEDGEWCGITIDGNHRYVHSDGTVTHNSGKSYGVGTFIERLTFEYNAARQIAHQILYTRYTMVSAGMSVIPEFLEKCELDGTDGYFHKAANDVVNTMTKSRVMFRGIHTSSGNQTAKLKSIHGLTVFVCDEAEEWTSETEFERIMLSIRTQGLKNLIVIIMNPASTNHWVYKRFLENTHRIEYYDGVPVQISTHPSVLHVHTTYLDNLEHLSEEFLKEVLTMKKNDPEKYAHLIMGQWASTAEGAIFKNVGIVDEFPSYAKKVARCVDFGYTNDVTAICRCGIVDNRIYIDELCYRSAMTSGDLIREFRQEAEHGDDGFVYSESADPRLVDEIGLGGIIIYPVVKGPGSVIAGITKLLDMEIFVTRRSIHAQDEALKYVWARDKDGNYVNEPEDHDNHIWDAVRYYVNGVLLGKVMKPRKVSKEDLGIY